MTAWKGLSGTRIAVVPGLVIAAGLTLYGLGVRPLLDAESRYAIVGYEMLVSGDWIQPRLDTLPYYEKPPLLYWAIALSYRAVGVGELGARLPSALAHVGTTLLVSALARILLGGVTAPMYAGLIYATAVGPLTYARYSFPDGMLVFWLTLSLLGLALAAQHRGGWALFYVGAAGAALDKGLVGLVFPFAAVATYALVTRDAGITTRLRPGWGFLILLGLFLPWHIALAARDPAFVPFYVLNEHVYRFLNVREPIDYVPLSLAGFWASTVFWFFPWALFLPGALLWSRRAAMVSLAPPLIWAAIVIGFFSLARSRLERYGLPAMPALAVVVAGHWHALTERSRRSAAITIPSLLLVLLGLAMIVVVFQTHGSALTDLVATLDGHYREHPDQAALVVEETLRLVRPFSILLVTWGVVTYGAARLGRAQLSLALWVVFLIPALLFVDHAISLLGSSRSQREAAEIISREWENGARVVVGGLYDDAMSVTFYTRRPTYVLDGNSTDLAFGFRQVPDSPLMLRSAQFDDLWRSSVRVFLLTDRRPWPIHSYVLLERPTYSLVTNRPPNGRSLAGRAERRVKEA